MPDETCRCEVLDPTTEGGGTDPRSCPEHAYEAGRRHERSVYVEERENARKVFAMHLRRVQDECAVLAERVPALQARVSELVDTIRMRQAEDDVHSSCGRNEGANSVLAEIAQRRGADWSGATV